MNTDSAWVRNLLSNALSMLNKNLTGFVQSLFSVQNICTVRKSSASRVRTQPHIWRRVLLPLRNLISFHQTLTNVLLVHHHAIKVVQTLSVITRAHACLDLDWTVMEKLATVRETKTI